MQLPTDQYVLIPLPNNAKLEKTSEKLFSLRVPELQIFNVWLRPHVVSSVDVTPEGVVIEVYLSLSLSLSLLSLSLARRHTHAHTRTHTHTHTHTHQPYIYI
jgi:hypothetical protein